MEQEPLRRREIGGGDVARAGDAREPFRDGPIDERLELRLLRGIPPRERLLEILRRFDFGHLVRG